MYVGRAGKGLGMRPGHTHGHHAPGHGHRAKEMIADNERLLQTYCQVVLAVFAIGFMLIELRNVVLPFFFALFLSLLYIPLIDLMTCRSHPLYRQSKNAGCRDAYKRRFRCCVGEDGIHDRNCWNAFVECKVDFIGIGRFPKAVAILVALGSAFLLLGLAGFIVYDAATELLEEKDKYSERFGELLDSFVEWAHRNDFEFSAADIKAEIDVILLEKVAVGFAEGTASFVTSTLLCMVFLIFILIARGTRELDSFVVGNSKLYSLRRKAEANVKRYIVIKTVISGCTGLLVGMVLALLGAPLPTVFGMLTFVLNFIPSIGSWMATFLPVPVILFDPEQTVATAVLAICLPGTVQLIIGDFIEPHFLGRLCKVDPIVVLLSLMLFGYLWGIPGMVLAVPITIVTKLLCKTAPHPIPRYVAGAIVGDLSKYKVKLDRDMARLKMSRLNLQALVDEERRQQSLERARDGQVDERPVGGGARGGTPMLSRARGYSDTATSDDEPGALPVELVDRVAEMSDESDDPDYIRTRTAGAPRATGDLVSSRDGVPIATRATGQGSSGAFGAGERKEQPDGQFASGGDGGTTAGAPRLPSSPPLRGGYGPIPATEVPGGYTSRDAARRRRRLLQQHQHHHHHRDGASHGTIGRGNGSEPPTPPFDPVDLPPGPIRVAGTEEELPVATAVATGASEGHPISVGGAEAGSGSVISGGGSARFSDGAVGRSTGGGGGEAETRSPVRRSPHSGPRRKRSSGGGGGGSSRRRRSGPRTGSSGRLSSGDEFVALSLDDVRVEAGAAVGLPSTPGTEPSVAAGIVTSPAKPNGSHDAGFYE